MNSNSSIDQILIILASVAVELEILAVDSKSVTTTEWLAYNNALVKVEEAMADLDELNFSHSPINKQTQDQQQINSLVSSKLKLIRKRNQEKALLVFNSIYVDIPESEREQKNQELRDMLKVWLEEDANKHYQDSPSTSQENN